LPGLFRGKGHVSLLVESGDMSLPLARLKTSYKASWQGMGYRIGYRYRVA
jgi:hypothetical protein